jgi:hypothetical protein
MRNPLRSTLHIAFLVAICCSVLTAAHAGNVPWLTGNFELYGFDPGGTTMYFFPPPDGELSLVPPADLPFTTGCFSCDDSSYRIDWTYYDGSAVGGSVAMLARFQDADPNLSFTGWMTGGHITGYIQTVCTLCVGDGFNEWTYDVDFRGTWSNGWWSEGTLLAMHVTSGDNYGSLELSTNTPEPGSFMLFGPSILGAAGLLRRRLGK